MTAGEDGAHPFQVLRLRHVVPEQRDLCYVVLFALSLKGVSGAERRVQIDQLDLATIGFDQLRQLFDVPRCNRSACAIPPVILCIV